MFVSWETLFWISHESLEPLLNLFYYISINGKWGWGALRSTQKLFIRLNHRASPQSLLKCHHITHWTHFRIIIIFFFLFSPNYSMELPLHGLCDLRRYHHRSDVNFAGLYFLSGNGNTNRIDSEWQHVSGAVGVGCGWKFKNSNSNLISFGLQCINSPSDEV